MTKQEYNEIMDFSNFMIDCANSYDRKIKEILEKNIAKKPIHNHHCPSCDEALPIKGITDDYCSECFNWNYCPNCGQKLDWE